MTQPIQSLTLPPTQDIDAESEWLSRELLAWLDAEYLPEPVNTVIAQRAANVFKRQRIEGENDIGCLLMAILTEMQSFDFTKSFYSEFAVANAVSDLLLEKIGINPCCG